MTINLSGQKFGRLTLVEQVKGKIHRFICDCGNEKLTSIHDVRRGMTKSCGCLQRETSSKNGSRPKTNLVNDLTDRRFGMLKVLRRAGSNKHGFATWVCLCDCGTEKVISGNHLSTGNTASCGCAYRERKTVRPAHRRAWSNEYVKARYRTNVRYAVNRRALHLIHASLKSRGSSKSQRWEELVGYTLDELERRLKKTMPSGYDWNDFLDGHLHIEHLTPLSAFNFETENDLDFRRAWALSNLRLFPGPDNLAKSDSLEGPFQPSLLM